MNIYELEKQATPGPWRHHKTNVHLTPPPPESYRDLGTFDPDIWLPQLIGVGQQELDVRHDRALHDAALTVHCRNNFLRALEALKEMQQLGAFVGDRLPIKVGQPIMMKLHNIIKELEEVRE
jgi:hypothetical protein